MRDFRADDAAAGGGGEAAAGGALAPSPPEALAELRARLVRPHCASGDCVLFDTRCFHFGLPNASAAVRRATLYVNYTQPWFARARVDKNWGGNSVFGDGGADVS